MGPNNAKSEIYMIKSLFLNDTIYLELYNKRDITLISVNIVSGSDIYRGSQASILLHDTLTSDNIH